MSQSIQYFETWANCGFVSSLDNQYKQRCCLIHFSQLLCTSSRFCIACGGPLDFHYRCRFSIGWSSVIGCVYWACLEIALIEDRSLICKEIQEIMIAWKGRDALEAVPLVHGLLVMRKLDRT